MKWTGLNELREQYLAFFASKEHLRHESFPLVPQGDKSLLLINSGMAPLKKYFLGVETPPAPRMTTCQKCMRTPDIERVGKTARHGTFFEMLGNFSFGDYFKNEATAWAWEFFTQVLEIPPELLYISVYEEDDEAMSIWTQRVGVEPSHMVRLGKEDNFWEHGAGPCGPCSEIYFDRGPSKGCGSPSCAVGCDCDRFVEVWNLVFTQFDSDGKGVYTPLAKPNIDTGMGLERLACVMQGVDNLFEVDTVANILNHAARLAGVSYKANPQTDVALRVITDHIRSTTFMVGDGITPSNEGRGYVLRRLLRRAARFGRMLGIKGPFLQQLAQTVIGENLTAYPELSERSGYILKVIGAEEERFAATLEQGIELLGKMLAAAIDGVLAGKDAFELYDTFGFPLDLTREIAAERSVNIDEEGFAALMNEQRTRARAARAKLGVGGWDDDLTAKLSGVPAEFVGYRELSASAEIMAVIKDGEFADTLGTGEEGTLVLDKTPFYAESGGQVGDTGIIKTPHGEFAVADCRKAPSGHYLHIGTVSKGVVSAGDTANAEVDRKKRLATMRNHTACHLLQAALRQVLGGHVNQSGSYVDSERLRFDFTHFQAMTTDELRATEAAVNEIILEALPVENAEMPIDEAKKLGAIALFGEKYGQTVRVVDVKGRSIEFCGGTHIDNTAKAGLFKIISEASVAAGVRRIEAVAGAGVLALIDNLNDTLHRAAGAFKLSNPAELAAKAVALAGELKTREKDIARLGERVARMYLDRIEGGAHEAGGIGIIAAELKEVGPDILRAICDTVKETRPNVVALIATVDGDKASVVCAAGASAVKAGAHAGNILKEALKRAGGQGGGRPDSAMGSCKAEMLDTVLSNAEEVVKAVMDTNRKK